MAKLIYLYFLIVSLPLFSQNPQINSFTLSSNKIEQYKKLEVSIKLNGNYSNPYDYDQIVLSGIFTSPSGNIDTIDGFFMQPYNINQSNGTLSISGGATFAVRYSPKEIGNYSIKLLAQDINGKSNLETAVFESIKTSALNNNGFVKTKDTNYFSFDNNNQYIPVGQNVAWQQNNIFLNYNSWVKKMSENKANFLRLWHAHWGLGIEWRAGGNYEGLKKYNQSNSAYQDWLYDYCDSKGIYVMLTIQHHGPVSTQVNSNWSDSPYNAVNGGPCVNTWNFFTNETAKKLTKNRLRYIVARWGYSKNILCWELFNEVEWTDNYQTNKESITDWHLEMAAYLKQIDKNDHLVTTSFAGENGTDRLWNDKNFDFTQIHFYNDLANIHDPISKTALDFIEKYKKPIVIGEFGLGGSASLANEDKSGVHIHNTMLATLFSGAAGPAATWWWDTYIEKENLYSLFNGPGQLSQQIDFQKQNVKPTIVKVSGAAGNLSLTTSLGWGEIGLSEIKIQDGATLPSNPRLNSFLYGSIYNTQFKVSPTFTFKYNNAGTFTLKTGTNKGTLPKITIYLDGVIVLNKSGEINTNYQIDIPAGEHTVKIENTGTDWINIDSYNFSELGSKANAYSISNFEKKYIAGYIINNEYNHKNIKSGLNIQEVNNLKLSYTGVPKDKNFEITWYETLSGGVLSTEIINSNNSILEISVPKYLWDLAYIIIEKENTKTFDSEIGAVNIYPNPIMSGEVISISTNNNSIDRISMFDVNGRFIANYNNQINIQLPNNITPGWYFLVIGSGKQSVVKKIVVINN